MDCQIIWSPEALEDIDAIAEYIQKDSPLYAQAVVERCIAASRALFKIRAGEDRFLSSRVSTTAKFLSTIIV